MAKELKELEQNKLISRTVTPDYPVKIAHRAASYANTLTPIIYALKEWGENRREKIFRNS